MRYEKSPRIRHRIEPLWDARNDAVTAFICLPDADAAGDLSGLDAAASRIELFLTAGERFLVCLPAPFAVLSSASGRARFLNACEAVSGGCRSYLVFLLDGIPADVTRAALVDAVLALRPFGRCIAGLPPGCRDLTPYMNHAVSGLALDFAGGFADSERTRVVIGCVGEAAQDLRWGAMALRLQDAPLLAAVQAADFRFLHGAGVCPSIHPAALPVSRTPDARAPRI
jgi:hypothetical protein